MMESILTLENGTFGYETKTVFSDLDLKLSPSEVFCILGANGCGKTTLLRCLSGSLHLRSGIVRLGGFDLSAMRPSEVARKIGVVFQDHSAPFPFSVLEVVRMGRAPHLALFSSPTRHDTELAERVLNQVGLLHLRDKAYTQISGGERQLVLIARTLAQEPEVILMDEPTSHLDFRNQAIVLQMANKLAQQGIAVLMTSHLPDHALLFSSKVALMHAGHFLAIGQPADVMTESTLLQTYGIAVKILEVMDGDEGKKIKLVIPARLS